MFERVHSAAEYQKVSQAEIIRQSIFFGLSEQSYYRALELADREGTSPSSIIEQSFSLADAVMNPDISVSDILRDSNPHISFADAMKSLSEIQNVLIVKLERKKEAMDQQKTLEQAKQKNITLEQKPVT